jgi:sulfotransferase
VAHVHFISGLPRSGSTLLAGIVRQDPALGAAMSSFVAGFVKGASEQMSANTESHSFFDEAKKKRICRAIFDASYADLNQPIIFNINRHWTARLHQLVELFDDFKVICYVRNPAWIMDSFETITPKMNLIKTSALRVCTL